MFKTSLQRNTHIQKNIPQAILCFESNKQDFSTTETVLQTKYRFPCIDNSEMGSVGTDRCTIPAGQFYVACDYTFKLKSGKYYFTMCKRNIKPYPE